MIKISLIADSLAMPRVTDEESIFIEESWPALLQSQLLGRYDRVVINDLSKRKRSIKSLKNESLYDEAIVFCKPDIVVIQIGVVDAAPRIFSTREQVVLKNKLFPRFIKKRIIKYRKANRNAIQERNTLRKVHTPPGEFKQKIKDFLIRIQNEEKCSPKIVIIPILGNLDEIDAKSRGFKSNVKLYNKLLKDQVSSFDFVYLLDQIEEANFNYCNDHYHLSVLGNQQIAKHLEKWIINQEKSK